MIRRSAFERRLSSREVRVDLIGLTTDDTMKWERVIDEPSPQWEEILEYVEGPRVWDRPHDADLEHRVVVAVDVDLTRPDPGRREMQYFFILRRFVFLHHC
jgi:hypothetical protein